jgi:AraC-like DNA-binding protein
MILKDFLPNPALREFVQCYRVVHFEFGNTPELAFKAYPPKPEECLHFFLRGQELVEMGNSSKKDYQLQVVVVGQQTAVMNRYIGGNFLNFTIVFQPAALFRLTGTPSSEFTNKYLDAGCIFPKSIGFVYEQLQYAQSYDEMILIADWFISSVVRNARKNAHLLDSVTRAMMGNDNNSIDWLAKESCLSPKQFKRKFNERTGVNPKTYSRIIRFTKAYNIKNAYPNIDWLRIAVECGYFDYQHLVKDYKDFTGQPPTEFHLLESKSPERTLGLSDEIYKSRARSSRLLV